MWSPSWRHGAQIFSRERTSYLAAGGIAVDSAEESLFLVLRGIRSGISGENVVCLYSLDINVAPLICWSWTPDFIADGYVSMGDWNIRLVVLGHLRSIENLALSRIIAKEWLGCVETDGTYPSRIFLLETASGCILIGHPSWTWRLHSGAALSHSINSEILFVLSSRLPFPRIQ